MVVGCDAKAFVVVSDRAARPGVLMVTGAYDPEMSGAGLQCRQLIREIRSAVDCGVLTTVTDPSLPLDDERDGIPVWRVPVDPSRFSSKVRAAWRMCRILWRTRRRFHILHFHGFSQKTVLAIVIGRCLGKAIVIKLTSVGHDDPMSMRARGALANWCYRQATMFFGVSPRFAELYREAGLPPQRFCLIPNGVDLARFSPASSDARSALRARVGVPRHAWVTLFVGFFSHEKCPDVLFEAWLPMAQRDPHQVLVLVGATRSAYYEVDPALADGIRSRAADAGVGDRVIWVERTACIEDYHRAADVFVLPSTREGLPNALLEAMACGTACVATRLPGVTDRLIDDGREGRLVPPRDVAALADALTALAADAETARAWGMRARARVAQEFSAKAMGAAYVAAYARVVTH